MRKINDLVPAGQPFTSWLSSVNMSCKTESYANVVCFSLEAQFSAELGCF